MALFFGKKEAKKASSGKNNTVVSKKGGPRIPRNVLETIPYRSVYPNGVIEGLDGRFSKSWKIGNANFSTEDEDKRINMYLDYEKIINSIVPGMIGQLTIFNRSIDQDTVRNEILLKPQNDGLNSLRDEWNSVFLAQMAEGRNNLRKDKCFTVSVKADDIMAAGDLFKSVDHAISMNLRPITGDDVSAMTIDDRLSMLYDIYNFDNDFPFRKKVTPIMKEGRIDFNTLHSFGMSSKELICPDAFRFMTNSFLIGEAHCAAFYIDRLPTLMSTDILNDISNISCNMIISVTYVPMEQGVALKYIQAQDSTVNAQIASIQEKGSNFIPSELRDQAEQTEGLIRSILSKDQKIFCVTPIVILIADTDEHLKQYQKELKAVLTNHMCYGRPLLSQQESALNTALPFAEMHVAADRFMPTEAASVFIPFNVKELSDSGVGTVNYGLNAVSRNMIRYNRHKADNFNGVILGKSGSGKSFYTKEEISQLALGTDDNIIIIDPEGEYSKIADALNATVVMIDTSNRTHINPLDMDIQYGGDEENPIAMKTDFMISLIEVMLTSGGGYAMSLSPVARTIVSRVTKTIYRSYMEIMKQKIEAGSTETCDTSIMPTLADFYEELVKQKEGEAQQLAAGIEPYCVGAYNTFAYRTNVDLSNRVIIYNVKNMTGGIKSLAMQVCMNASWNAIIQNGRKGKFTDFYIDEFHLFTKTATSAKFVQNIYKRARKYRGMPTGITQNISDLLTNEESRAMIDNCDFVVMMNQSPLDRITLSKMYEISPALQEYMADKRGVGIIFNGKTLIPFENKFPVEKARHLFSVMESDVHKDVEQDEKK